MTEFIFKKPARLVTKVFIHCSASDNPAHDDISVIRKWHMSPAANDPSKPWSDVGYHFFIKKDGTIQPGRPLERKPAAQHPFNAGTIAICVSGLLLRLFTEAQFDAVRAVCRGIQAQLPAVTFHGHCEVSPKACPVFDYKAVLGLDKKGLML